MKKKILFIPLFLLLIGCDSKYQVSNLKLTINLEENINYFNPFSDKKESYLTYKTYIVGAFKNNSNKICKKPLISIEITSGNLKIYESIRLNDEIKPDEIQKIKYYCKECDILSNDINNVKIIVKKIECNN